MSRIGALRAEIARLKRKIVEYETDLKEITQIKGELPPLGASLNSSVIVPVGRYDMTGGDNWIGNLQVIGQKKYTTMRGAFIKGKSSISTLMGEIGAAIAKINELIAAAKKRIAECEAEIARIEAEEAAAAAARFRMTACEY